MSGMTKAFRHALALAALSLLSALPLRAQSLSDIMSAELLPGWRTEAGSHMAAIRLKLSQGWKTYWRSPGDAGIPPEFDWRGSDNVKGVRIHWPTPQVFDFNGMQTIGYDHELVLPVEIFPATPGQPMRLETSVDLGVCRDICVPANVRLGGVLTPASAAADPTIRAALRAQPVSARSAGLRSHRCTLEPSARGMRLRAELEMPRLGPEEVVVVETRDPAIWVTEAQVSRSGNRLVAVSDLIATNRQPFMLDRSGLTITVLANGRAVEVSGCPGG